MAGKFKLKIKPFCVIYKKHVPAVKLDYNKILHQIHKNIQAKLIEKSQLNL